MGKKSDKQRLELFSRGKYTEYAAMLKNCRPSNTVDVNVYNCHINNNIFVAECLGADWESMTVESRSHLWAENLKNFIDLHGTLRCLEPAVDVPNELILCNASNTLSWSIMSVDPINQHSSSIPIVYEIAAHALKRVLLERGEPFLSGVSKTHMEELLKLMSEAKRHLLWYPPRQCLLIFNMLILLLVFILYCGRKEISETIAKQCLVIVDDLIEIVPQVEIHIPTVMKDQYGSRIELVYFDINGAGEIITQQKSRFNASTTSIILSVIASVFCLYRRNLTQALDYVQAENHSSDEFSFLTNYMKGVINCEKGNLDKCLYHLSRIPVHSMDALMQARHCTLKSLAFFKQEKYEEALMMLKKTFNVYKDIRLPISAFIMADVYGKLGQSTLQIEVLDLLTQCIIAENPLTLTNLSSPTFGIEHKLLLLVHPQPEISVLEVLYASATALLDSKGADSETNSKEAGKRILNLLRIIMNDKQYGRADSTVTVVTLPPLQNLLHFCSIALIRADCAEDAEIVCEAALDCFQSDRDEGKQCLTISENEDVVALCLLAEAQCALKSSEIWTTLNKAISVLQKCEKKSYENKSSLELNIPSMLLARIYFLKAQMNVNRDFKEDAKACFQRALTYNPNDGEILLHFGNYLLDVCEMEASSGILRMFQELRPSDEISDPVLRHLLGGNTSSALKDHMLSRLKMIHSSMELDE